MSKSSDGVIGIGPLLSTSWKIYKKNFKTVVGITLVTISFNIILGFLLSFSGLTNISNPTTASIGPASGVFLFLVMIAGVAVYLWGYLALLFAVSRLDKGISIGEAFKLAQSKFFSYIWIGILMTFVIFGGTLFFIIPGIIFSLWISLAQWVLIEEKVSGMPALLRSREYVRGRVAGLFLRHLVLGFISFIISFLISLPIIILVTIMAGAKSDSLINAKAILNWITTLLLVPFGVIYNYVIYENFKALRGKFTLSPKSTTRTVFKISSILGLVFAVLVGFIALGGVLTLLKNPEIMNEAIKQQQLLKQQQMQNQYNYQPPAQNPEYSN